MGEYSQKQQDPTKEKATNFYRESRLEIPSTATSRAELVTLDGISAGKIKNLSEFGLRVIINEQPLHITVNKIIPRVDVYLNGKHFYSGQCKIVDEKQIDGGLSLGLFLMENAIDLDRAFAIISFGEYADELEAKFNVNTLSDQVSEEFKIVCADFMYFLNSLAKSLEYEEARIKSLDDTNRSLIANLEDQFIDFLIHHHTKTIRGHFTKFQTIVEKFSLQEHQIHKRYFRELCHPLLLRAPFVRRAFEKPLGYAGDYGLMLMFYEYDHLGESLFAKFIHRYACNEPSAVANQNRVDFLSQLLMSKYLNASPLNEAFKLTSIASGPAKEVRLLMEKLKLTDRSPSLELVLVDQEEEALEYCLKSIRSQIRPDWKLKTKLLREDAVMGIIKKSQFTQEIFNSNVIVSAGLFDYLSDRVASKMIESLFEFLAPNGDLLVGNVSNQSPDQFSMNYLMEWNLFLRSPEDLVNLVPDKIKQTAKIEVISEPLGINLFLRVTRK